MKALLNTARTSPLCKRQICLLGYWLDDKGPFVYRLMVPRFNKYVGLNLALLCLQNPSFGLVTPTSSGASQAPRAWVLALWSLGPLFPLYDLVGYQYPYLQSLITLCTLPAHVAICTYFTFIPSCVLFLFYNYHTPRLFFKSIINPAQMLANRYYCYTSILAGRGIPKYMLISMTPWSYPSNPLVYPIYQTICACGSISSNIPSLLYFIQPYPIQSSRHYHVLFNHPVYPSTLYKLTKLYKKNQK